jgi:hypothetical protein
LQKGEFGKMSLIYLGHMIRGRELRVDLEKIVAITQWPITTIMTEVRSFMVAAKNLRKFIIFFSTTVTPLHALTANGESFHWGKQQQRKFEDLKNKINNALVLAMPNLQQPFELETDASGYALGVVLIQGGRHVRYHSYIFDGAVLHYPTYDNEIFVIV